MNGTRPNGMLPHLSERFVKLATIVTKIVKKVSLANYATSCQGFSCKISA
jgi:hypothetical protein